MASSGRYARTVSTVGQSTSKVGKKWCHVTDHQLDPANFKSPTFCDYCNEFIWGLSNQGHKCAKCGYNVHNKCVVMLQETAKTVFGFPLTKMLELRHCSPQSLPSVVYELLCYLHENAIAVDGVFRFPGDPLAIQRLRKEFNKGESPSHNGTLQSAQGQPHTAAQLLLLWFKELPEGVFTVKKYEDFLDAGERFAAQPAERLRACTKLLESLPDVNRAIVKALFQLLFRISREPKNKADAVALGRVWGPVLLRLLPTYDEVTVQAMSDTPKIQSIVAEMIAGLPSLWPDYATAELSPPTKAEQTGSRRQHAFAVVHFSKPTFCKYCTAFIWGLGRQGAECTQCGYTIHHKCLPLLLAQDAECTGPIGVAAKLAAGDAAGDDGQVAALVTGASSDVAGAPTSAATPSSIDGSQSRSDASSAAGGTPVAGASSLPPKAHTFKKHHFNSPTYCAYCAGFIWGLGYQGAKCKDCGYPTHFKCEKHVLKDCGHVLFSKDAQKKMRKGTAGKSQDDGGHGGGGGGGGGGVGVGGGGVGGPDASVAVAAPTLVSLPRKSTYDIGGPSLSGGGDALRPPAAAALSTPTPSVVVGDAGGGAGASPKPSSSSSSSSSSSNKALDWATLGVAQVHIESSIGQGTFAEVFRGSVAGHKEPVAIKRFFLNQQQVGLLLPKMTELIGRLRTVQQQPLLRVYGMAADADCIMMVTALAHSSLEAMLYASEDDAGAFTWAQRAHVLEDVVRGMRFLHAQSPPLLHYDLKPSNIMLSRDANGAYAARVSDEGLSMVMSYSETGESEGPVGSPFYMAPEVLIGEAYTPAADVYSFGIVVWELFTGEKPYLSDLQKFETYEDMVNAIVEQEYRLTMPNSCPEHVKKIITTSWGAKADKRPTFEKLANEKLA